MSGGATIDRGWAESFARDWAACWNARDLEAGLAHYAEDVVFRSPRIAAVLGNDAASVSGRQALRAYWMAGLARTPRIQFDLEAVGVGSGAITIIYRNQRGERVAETLVFGRDARVTEGIVTYLPTASA